MREFDREALGRVLLAHAEAYPLMAPQDAVKLLYQNEFGPGHLISDPQESLARLREEAASLTPAPGAPLLEDIGGGMVRLALAPWLQAAYPLEALNRDFVRSARLAQGDRETFAAKLSLLRELARQGRLPFSAEALEDYLAGYEARGCPPVSHSEAYRQAYRPAYRVVRAALSLPCLLRDIARRLEKQQRLILALDGRCASGKTTLAGELARRYGWSVVHMDHFFLRPEQRTPERYATPGENVDHERFLEEVLLPLGAGKAVAYHPFDCHAQRLASPVTVPPAAVTVVEGSYSCHPALWPHYDLRVFLTVEPREQARRIEAREGPAYARVFREKWIPLEEAYFAAEDLPRRCDYCLEL